MLRNICIITIVDSISATSMPVNEFVLFRQRHNYGFREVLVSCLDHIPDNVEIPDGIEVQLVGRRRHAIRHVLKQMIRRCRELNERFVIHLHAQKSALQFFSASIGLGLRKNVLFTVHSTYGSRNLRYKVSSCFCSLLSEYANCVSEAAYKEYNATVKRWKGRKMLAIQNGVDFQRIKKATEQLPPHTDVVDMYKMVCVGRMIPIKNQQFLVRLLKGLSDTKLILIGQEDDTIKTLAEKEGVADRVEMTGLLPRDEVFCRLNECGLYVSASLVEGMPVSVLEAMSVGLVPVLSNIAPHQEVAKSGMLFNALPLVAKDWVQTIRNYQQMEPDELRRLSQLIKKNVREQFSLEAMHQKYIAIYEQLAK